MFTHHVLNRRMVSERGEVRRLRDERHAGRVRHERRVRGDAPPCAGHRSSHRGRAVSIARRITGPRVNSGRQSTLRSVTVTAHELDAGQHPLILNT